MYEEVYIDEKEFEDYLSGTAFEGYNRPATSKPPTVPHTPERKNKMVNFRVDETLLQQINEYSNKWGLTRSESIRQLVEIGIEKAEQTVTKSRKLKEELVFLE